MNRHRELAQMMRVTGGGQPPIDIPTNGLLHWWRFNEGTGGTITDHGSSPLDGTIEENTTPAWDAANWVFDNDIGRDVYKNISANTNCVNISGISLPTQPWTMIFHVKNTNITSGSLRVIDCETNRHIIEITVTSSTAVDNDLRVYRASWYNVSCLPDVFDIGSWHQIALVVDTSSAIEDGVAYVDGVLEMAPTTYTAASISGSARIASHNNGTIDSANGLLYTDALIYDRPVTTTELTDIRSAVLGSN